MCTLTVQHPGQLQEKHTLHLRGSLYQSLKLNYEKIPAASNIGLD